MLGSMAGVGLIQGSVILLNIFFGPLINAAFAIAISLYNAILSLANSIILAFRAPMIKAYAVGEMQSLDTMFGISNKCILFLLGTATIPLFIEMKQVLTLWIGSPSEEMVTFGQLILIYTMCLSLNSPITTIIQATGNIKKYYVCTDSMTLMHLPIAYIMLRLGCPSYSVLLSMIFVIIIAHTIRIIILCRCHETFNLHKYLIEFLLQGVALLVISFIITSIIKQHLSPSIINTAVIFIVSPIITLTLFAIFGISQTERHNIRTMAIKFIKRK